MWKKYSYYIISGAVAAAVWISIIIASGAGWNPLNISWNFSAPGAFGDSFGPINTVMATIAAIGAIAAYRAQQGEITRLRKREALDDKRRALEEIVRSERQAIDDEASRIAAFEATYFKLLEAFRNIVSETDISGESGTRVARDAFKAMVKTASRRLAVLDNLRAVWSEVSVQYENDLNHYFRFMYHLVKYVDSSPAHNKYFYITLLRAHLSESELVLLALNCVYGEGCEKFKPLVEKYAMLHNISQASINKWNLFPDFEYTAFGLK